MVKVLLQDAPLAGAVATPLANCLLNFHGPGAALVRGPALSGKSGAFARMQDIALFDAVLLDGGPAALQQTIGARRTPTSLVVLDGLERMRPDALSDLGWVEDVCVRAGVAPVIVMRDRLPRPAGLSIAVDALVVPSPSRFASTERACRFAQRLLRGRPPEDVEALLQLSLESEREGGGFQASATCLGRSIGSGGGLHSSLVSLADSGLVRVERGNGGPRVVIGSTVIKEYCLALALSQGRADPGLALNGDTAELAYFAEEQALAPLVRSLVWANASAMAVYLAQERYDDLIATLLEYAPVLAASALEIAAELGLHKKEHAEALQLLRWRNEDSVPLRASRITLLDIARGSSSSDLSVVAPSFSECSASHLSVAPVSNQEFRRFVAKGGYHERAWWSWEGWSWRTGRSDLQANEAHWSAYMEDIREQGVEVVRKARGWRPGRYRLLRYLASLSTAELSIAVRRMMARRRDEPAFFEDSRFNGPSKPVVGVNYYEAEAFCCWLSYTLSKKITLPSLSEWETESEGFAQFPWGDEFHCTLANTLEAGLGSTTPIGTYPLSSKGLLDTCGNVWEWTRTSWPCDSMTPPSGKAYDGVAYKAVKGGSWDNRSTYASRGVFDIDPPDIFGTRLGFRVYYEGRPASEEATG